MTPTHDLPDAAALRTAVEPRRLQILQLVWDRELGVTEIAARLPVSVAAVSQHLAKLRAAGLVSVRAEGRRRLYRATKADMGALAAVLEAFWRDRLGELKRLAEDTDPPPTPPAPRRPSPADGTERGRAS